MPQSTCPYCLARIDLARLAYQCTGRGQAPCKKAPDQLRIERTDNYVETFPTFEVPARPGIEAECPLCGGSTRRRACPSCHSALPVAFQNGPGPLIGLVGTRGSGRTVLMSVFLRQLSRQLGQQLEVATQLITDIDAPADFLSQEWSRRNFDDNGILPSAGGGERGIGRSILTLLEWSRQRHRAIGRDRVESRIVSFLDMGDDQRNTPEHPDDLDHLRSCDALILAIDPFAVEGALGDLPMPPSPYQLFSFGRPIEVVASVAETLSGASTAKKGRIKVPVAVVVTKLDAFYGSMDAASPLLNPPEPLPAYQKADGKAVHDQIRALLEKWDGGEIDRQLASHYDNFRYFGVSSLGTEPNAEEATVDISRIRPLRAEDPFLWLLSEADLVDVR